MLALRLALFAGLVSPALAEPAPESAPQVVTCTAETAWVAGGAGGGGATMADAQRWTETRTGAETETRAALQAACERAKTKPDRDGLKKYDFETCTITCGPPRGSRLTLSVLESDRSAFVEPLKRVRVSLQRCVESTKTADRLPMVIKLAVGPSGVRRAHDVSPPELGRCIDSALTGVKVDALTVAPSVSLRMAWSEPDAGG